MRRPTPPLLPLLSPLLSPLLALVCLSAWAAGPLNDTGLTQCYDGVALSACSAANAGDTAVHPRQDARFGRDAKAKVGTLNKIGGGVAGFDFTALDAGGNPVAPGSHACVRDNATGLVWSGETFSANWTDAAATASGHTRCGLAISWRLPSRRELLSIVNNGANRPAIDSGSFPGTVAGAYWSDDAYGLDGTKAWYVDFDDGGTGTGNKGASHAVRLVSNGINHAPGFVKGPDQSVLVDAGPQSIAGWATGMQSGDPVTQALHFVVSNDNNALFDVQPAVDANGTLIYTPAANASGHANVMLRLADDGGIANGGVDTSAPQSFVITVTPVNQAPRITLGQDIVLPKTWRPAPIVLPGWATNIAPGPANEAGQHLTATVRLLPVSGQKAMEFDSPPTLDPATGTLSFTIKYSLVESFTPQGVPLIDWFSAAGLARVEVELKDDGGTANGGTDTTRSTFTIFLDPVPTAVALNTRSPWRSPCVPILLAGWDADTNFDLPAGYEPGRSPNPWLTARVVGLPQQGYLTRFVQDQRLLDTPSPPAAQADANVLQELVPARTPLHKLWGFNFYGAICYVPFQATYTGFDSFSFEVVDADGNVSSPTTLEIEIFEN